MADSILLTPDSRFLQGSGIADFAHYGAQPDPIVSFAPASTDARPIDPLGTARAAGSAAPTTTEQPALGESLSFTPPIDVVPAAAPTPAPLSDFDIAAPQVRAPAEAALDSGPAPLAGSGSLTPVQFQAASGDPAPGPLAASLAPDSLQPSTIGSAVPVVDQLFSNVAALQAPVAQLLAGVDQALITPIATGVVAPVTQAVVDPLVSNVAAPLLQDVNGAADALLTPVEDLASGVVAPTIGAVGEAAAPVTNTLADAVQPVAEAVAPTIGVVGDTAEPVLAAVGETVAPLTDALSPVTDALASAVDPLTQPNSTPASDAPAPITGNAVDAGIATLVDLVQASDMILPPPTGAEPGAPAADLGSIVDTLISPDPEDHLLGATGDESSPDDGDNDGPLGLGGI